MPRSKSRQKNRKNRVNPTGQATDNAEIQVAKAKVLPVVSKLSSADAGERSWSCAAIATLVTSDAQTRKLLLKEGVVSNLVDRLTDNSQEVVVEACGALRNIASEEGFEVCREMWAKNILTPLGAAVPKLSSVISDIIFKKPVTTPEDEITRKLVWTYAENVVSLIWSLSETTEDILKTINKMSPLVPFIMLILQLEDEAPATLRLAAAQCLYTLTDDNEFAVQQLIEDSAYADLLVSMAQKPQQIPPLTFALICGILHNIADTIAKKPTITLRDDLTHADQHILPHLVNFVNSIDLTALAQSYMEIGAKQPAEGTEIDIKENPHADRLSQLDSQFAASHLALEIIAGIATAVQGVSEEDGIISGPADEDEEEDGEEDEDDEVMDDEHGEHIGDEDDALPEELMQEDDRVPDISESSQSILAWLITNVTSILVRLATPAPSNNHPGWPTEHLKTVNLRAIDALNNIAWTSDSVIPREADLWGTWQEQAGHLWKGCYTTLVPAFSADERLLEAVIGFSWGIAKGVKGAVDVSAGEVQTLIQMYNKVQSVDLKVKAVGVLGCIAQQQNQIAQNKEIGSFLISQIVGLPHTPTPVVVEALNVIYDVYSDAEFDYDEPVFVQLNFVRALERARNNVKAMVKAVDRRRNGDLRMRADEAYENLVAFVEYKKSERD
ncbi:hypothetical protein YB2330_001216 [Saitoella coloradoensis]